MPAVCVANLQQTGYFATMPPAVPSRSQCEDERVGGTNSCSAREDDPDPASTRASGSRSDRGRVRSPWSGGVFGAHDLHCASTVAAPARRAHREADLAVRVDRSDTPHRIPESDAGSRDDRVMPQISKGARELLVTRPNTSVVTAARRRVDDLGYKSMSDYLAALIARDVQMPDLAPLPVDRSTRQELPIADVA